MLRPRGRRLIRGVGRTAVVAGTAGVVSGRVHHHQHQKWAREEQERLDAGYYPAEAPPQPVAAAPPPQPPAAEDDVLAKIKELATLHESGVLTDDEFSAAKDKLLHS
ncbi:MAG: SHOCT domain-containing protein [Acidimicrobiales bacterium]